MTEILACDVPDNLIELSTGQFVKFFQISSLPNATRILRRIYNSPNSTKIYKGYQVKVSYFDGQYLAIVTPLQNSSIFGAISTFSNESSKHVFSEPFCDWLTIHQQFDFQLPVLNGGCVVSLNSIPERNDGRFDFSGEDIEFMTTKYVSHKGSYETNLQLRVDNGKLTLSGNVGRFGRQDNLFGFSLLHCVQKANRILDSLRIGLPHFSPGSFFDSVDKYSNYSHFIRSKKNLEGEIVKDKEFIGTVIFNENSSKRLWTGAYFSQLHLTKNLFFSNADEATLFMDHACRLNPWGMNVSPHYGQGVHYGKGSQYVNPKLYLKGLELQENRKKYKYIDEKYRNKLIEYINNRIVRFEVNYKSKYLSKNKVKFLGDIMDESKLNNVLYADFRQRLETLVHNRVDFYEGLESLTRRQKEQFYSWTRGTDIRENYSLRTYFYLKRLFWKKLNVDISIPYSEQHSILKIRTLSCFEVNQIPEFYELSAEFDTGLKLIA